MYAGENENVPISPLWSLNSEGFAGNENEVDLVWFRARLRRITNTELVQDIRAGQHLCSPRANFLQIRYLGATESAINY